MDEMLDIAAGFAFCPSPAGRRVGIMSGSGGAGVWMADMVSLAGLEMPSLDPAARAACEALMPAYGSAANPVDLTAGSIGKVGYAPVAGILQQSPVIDAVVIVGLRRQPEAADGGPGEARRGHRPSRQAHAVLRLHRSGAAGGRCCRRGRAADLHLDAGLRAGVAGHGRPPRLPLPLAGARGRSRAGAEPRRAGAAAPRRPRAERARVQGRARRSRHRGRGGRGAGDGCRGGRRRGRAHRLSGGAEDPVARYPAQDGDRRRGAEPRRCRGGARCLRRHDGPCPHRASGGRGAGRAGRADGGAGGWRSSSASTATRNLARCSWSGSAASMSRSCAMSASRRRR